MKPNNEIIDQVKNETVEMLSRRNAPPVNLYIENSVLPAGAVINAQHQQIPVTANSVMVFADEDPLFNWGHNCRYFFYSVDNGTLIDEVPAQFPPYLVNAPATFELFHEMVRPPIEPPIWPRKPSLHKPIKIPYGNRFAILFSGASNNRHTNDLEFLYRTLIEHYAFRPENIYVLNYNGTLSYSGGASPTWPGDGTPYRMPVKGKGTRIDLDAVLDDLKNRLQLADLLLIHTNNHGGRAAESYLCTYSGPGYPAPEFAAKLATLPKFTHLVVMMEQCFSGGFSAPILAHSKAMHTSVATACNATSSSIGGANFDPFARDWIAAMTGHAPSGGALPHDPDANHNGRISAQEAYGYALAVKDPYDTPTYGQTSTTAGECHLAQRYIVIPWLPLTVAETLKPYEDKLPPDVYYSKLYHELGPSLEALEQEIQARENDLREQMAPRLAELVAEVMAS
jgi:hypothetical protein